MLAVAVNELILERMTNDYAMEHLWLLTSAVYAIGGGKLETPRYITLTHPNHEDTRTPEEIKRDILQKLVS